MLAVRVSFKDILVCKSLVEEEVEKNRATLGRGVIFDWNYFRVAKPEIESKYKRDPGKEKWFEQPETN